MNIGFYTGASGLVAFQGSMNVVGNNIANSETIGYKPTESTFENLLQYRMYVNSTAEPLQGTGARNVTRGMDMEQGPMERTGNDMDYALTGDGFFAVDNGGTPAYTRCGAFAAAPDSTGTYYLADQRGHFVLNARGGRIPLTRDQLQGRYNDVSKQIGVFQFKNPNNLTPLSDNLYAENTASGQVAAGNAKVTNGFLEQSQTQLSTEMANMILAQRGFQLSARVLQANNEVEDIVNNLRS
ncbi:MAG: flagellar hook basal-body protein [Oscillospiraceae bacterium]|jgi:flagellar basal-body rod protein FlgG|nr:flagellar hook basal-body protein [Oscillospiraceae bacterium]